MSGQPNRGTEGVIATAAQELAVHEKKELVSKEEKTVPDLVATQLAPPVPAMAAT